MVVVVSVMRYYFAWSDLQIRNQLNYVDTFDLQWSPKGKFWRFEFQCGPFVNAGWFPISGVTNWGHVPPSDVSAPRVSPHLEPDQAPVFVKVQTEFIIDLPAVPSRKKWCPHPVFPLKKITL